MRRRNQTRAESGSTILPMWIWVTPGNVSSFQNAPACSIVRLPGRLRLSSSGPQRSIWSEGAFLRLAMAPPPHALARRERPRP